MANTKQTILTDEGLKKLEEETGMFGSLSDKEIAVAAGKSYQDLTALRDPLMGLGYGEMNANAEPSAEREGTTEADPDISPG